MHIPESVLENEMHKVLCDFDIQMDYLISAKPTDLEIINKKGNSPISGFSCLRQTTE